MCRKILSILMLSISPVFLGACSHVAGNVVPDDGPTMESIYDEGYDNVLGENHTLGASPTLQSPMVKDDRLAESFLKKPDTQLPASVDSPTFYQLNNPPLKIYIFPHFAGSEMLPIPGYWTAFSAYPRSYYALPLAADLNADTKNHPGEVQP